MNELFIYFLGRERFFSLAYLLEAGEAAANDIIGEAPAVLRGEPLKGGPILIGIGVFFDPGGLRSSIFTSICLSGSLLRIIIFLLELSASRIDISVCSCKEARAAAVSASRPVYLAFLKKSSVTVNPVTAVVMSSSE